MSQTLRFQDDYNWQIAHNDYVMDNDLARPLLTIGR